jgi:WD40 repeat protein
MLKLAKWNVSAGVFFGALAVLVVGNAALGEDALKEAASAKQDYGAYLLAFAPDGKSLLSANSDVTAFSYDVPTLKQKKKLLYGSKLSCLAITADGKSIVAAESKAIVVRDFAGEEEPKTLKLPDADKRGVTIAALSADGKTVAGAVGTDIFIWDIVADKQVAKLVVGGGTNIQSLAVSPDGKSVASASHHTAARLWDVETAKEKATLTSKAQDTRLPSVGAIAWAPDGKVFATAEQDELRTWFGGSGKGKTIFSGHKADVACVAFFPDGKMVVTGGEDKTVNVWDCSEGAIKGTLKFTDGVKAVAVSPDGKLIAVGLSGASKNNVFLYNVADVVK